VTAGDRRRDVRSVDDHDAVASVHADDEVATEHLEAVDRPRESHRTEFAHRRRAPQDEHLARGHAERGAVPAHELARRVLRPACAGVGEEAARVDEPLPVAARHHAAVGMVGDELAGWMHGERRGEDERREHAGPPVRGVEGLR